MLDEIKDAHGAIDLPDVRDYSAVHLFGEPDVELPKSVNLNNVPSHNQDRTMHCTAYAITHCEEILNTIEHQMQALADPEEQWANQKFERGNPSFMEKEGDSLQNALNTLLKYGLNNKSTDIKVDKFKITGYAKIANNIDTVKRWLAKGYPIYTGSGNHCYALVGYHDGLQEFIAKNSYGPKWGKNGDGTFGVGYSEFSKLFSKYILYDVKDIPMIYQDVSENSPMAEAIKFCLKAGLMRGYGPSDIATERKFLPDQPVTRAELAQVINNLCTYLKQ